MKILEGIITENSLSPEVQSLIEEKFNELVEVKATEIASNEISLKEKSLEESYNEKISLIESNILSSLDNYLDDIVESFKTEVKTALKDKIDAKQNDLILNVFENMVLSTGVDVLKIKKEYDNSIDQEKAKLQEAEEKYQSLLERYSEVKDENNQLKINNKIDEMCEGMTIIQSDKFKKVAKLIDFDNSFSSKLQTLRESILSSEDLKESNEELNESTDKSSKTTEPSWKRFV